MSASLKLRALKHVFLPGASTIETGTYGGETSRALASLGFKVHTIEISESISAAVFPKLEAMGIKCYLGDSAEILPTLIDALRASGETSANFWLDGHWSGGITGTAEGHETPIVAELQAIRARRQSLERVVVAVDDVRCFGNDPAYPDKKFLVDWATDLDLRFFFLADIFVASTERHANL